MKPTHVTPSTLSLTLSLIAFVGLACSKPAPPPPPVVTIDVDGVNGAVPAPLRSKITFGKRDLTAKSMLGSVTFSLAVPNGWVQEAFQLPGQVELHPPYDQGFGNLTRLRLKSDCGGECVAKDWAPVAAANLSKFGSPVKTVREEKAPGSHLRVTDDGETLYLEYAFWYPGSTRYFSCEAGLAKNGSPENPDARPALAAFEKACRAVNVTVDATKR